MRVDAPLRPGVMRRAPLAPAERPRALSALLLRQGAVLALGLASMGGFVGASLAAFARAADVRAMLVVVCLSLGVFAGALLHSDPPESAAAKTASGGPATRAEEARADRKPLARGRGRRLRSGRSKARRRLRRTRPKTHGLSLADPSRHENA
jgi:hypothetical protein